jgi:hypothetical protein
MLDHRKETVVTGVTKVTGRPKRKNRIIFSFLSILGTPNFRHFKLLAIFEINLQN